MHLLSQYILHRLTEPLPCLASVVSVNVNPDLRNAKIFVKVNGGQEDEASARVILETERVRMQKYVASELKVKFCPVLKFIVGGGSKGPMDEVDRMLAELHKPKF